MRTAKKLFLQLCCLVGIVLFSHEIKANSDLIFEQFETLDRWRPFTFPKIDTKSSYNVVADETGVTSCLEMVTRGGASALILDEAFDVYDYPILSWRWKVDGVYTKGDFESKEGDDYPARLYVMFAYEPIAADWVKKLQYITAKLLYGEYPPDSTLNYIWSNRTDSPDIITNVYVEEAKMLPVDRGRENLGMWRRYKVDIVADYKKAFGTPPPRTATLAVMIDSDNTQESGRSCIDYIRLSRRDAASEQSISTK